MNLMHLSPDVLLSVMAGLNYPVFTGDYNLNLIGIRNMSKPNSNEFNDVLCVLYQVNGRWHMHLFPFTTDPGSAYREHPINSLGTAILVPGHYASCWRIGSHKGKYSALVQCGEMRVYRDNNKDDVLDTDVPIDKGLFGINLHRANENIPSFEVNKWSAGCQVMPNSLDFDVLMSLVRKAVAKYGAYFSYTLLTEADV